MTTHPPIARVIESLDGNQNQRWAHLIADGEKLKAENLAMSQATRAGALRAEPQASQAKPLIAIAGGDQ